MREAALAELQHLHRENGGLILPSQVVDHARALTSPLHHYFTWDDGRAAELHRLSEARSLLRAAVTIIENPDLGPMQVRTFVSLPSDRDAGGGYRALVEVMTTADHAAEAMSSLQRDIDRLRLKYRSFAQLAVILDAIEAAAAAPTEILEAPAVRRRGRRAAQTSA